MTEKKGEYFPFLEGLRGLAALYVAVHHMWLDTWNPFIHLPPPGRLVAPVVNLLAYGHAAVAVFIAISGFCLMLPIARAGKAKSWRTFFKRRALRILPPYYVAVLVGVLIAFLMHWRVSWAGLLTHLFLVHNLTEYIFDLNGPLWSIATESQIYLLFPALVWVAFRWGTAALLLLTGIAGYWAAYHYQSWQGLERNPHFIFIFALGMFAAMLVYRPIKFFCSQFALTTLLAFSTAGMIMSYHRYGPWRNVHYTDLFTGAVSFCLLAICSQHANHMFAKILAFKPLLFVGSFSYSLYLVHQPLQALFNHYVLSQLHYPGNLMFLLRLAFLPVILVFAYLFFLGLEKPILVRSKRGAKVVAPSEPMATLAEPSAQESEFVSSH